MAAIPSSQPVLARISARHVTPGSGRPEALRSGASLGRMLCGLAQGLFGGALVLLGSALMLTLFLLPLGLLLALLGIALMGSAGSP